MAGKKNSGSEGKIKISRRVVHFNISQKKATKKVSLKKQVFFEGLKFGFRGRTLRF